MPARPSHGYASFSSSYYTTSIQSSHPSSSSSSSFGELHDAEASIDYFQHGAPPAVIPEENEVSPSFHRSSRRRRRPQFEEQATASDRMEVTHQMRPMDGGNVHRLFAFGGILIGGLIGIGCSQISRDLKSLTLLTRWLTLPSDLYVACTLGVLMPTIFVSGVRSMLVLGAETTSCMRSKLYRRLAFWWIVTTLIASVVGVLLGLCFAPLFPTNPTMQTMTSAGPSSSMTRANMLRNPLVQFRCPALEHEPALLLRLFSNGSWICTNASSASNDTIEAFRLEDLANSFYMKRLDTEPRVLSFGEHAIVLLESLFPWNVVTAFVRGDIVSVLLLGMALGSGLYHSRRRPLSKTPSPSAVMMLFLQAESLLSLLLSALLRLAPIGMVFMVASHLLQAHVDRMINNGNGMGDLVPSTQDVVLFLAALVVGLLVNLLAMCLLVFLVIHKNPLPTLQYLIPPQLMAFGGSSSLLALPSTIRSMASAQSAPPQSSAMSVIQLICTSATSLHKTGTAVYLGLATVYLLCSSGGRDDPTQFSFMKLLLLVLASAFGSIVVPPMPHGNLLVLPTILMQCFGMTWYAPAVAFLAAMDWICDPLTTMMNVVNDGLVTVVLTTQWMHDESKESDLQQRRNVRQMTASLSDRGSSSTSTGERIHVQSSLQAHEFAL